MNCVRLAIACLAYSGLAATGASASINFTTDRTAYFTAHPVLIIEDYSEAIFSASSESFASPLNNLTNNGTFAPGDIVGGLEISTNLPTAFDLYAGAGGVSGRLSNVVGTNDLDSVLQLAFTPGASTSGIDLFDPLGNDVLIEVYGSGGLLDSTTIAGGSVGAPSFIGINAAGVVITRIDLTSQNPGYVNTYQVAFSTVPAPAALPAGLLLLGALGTRRRRVR